MTMEATLFGTLADFRNGLPGLYTDIAFAEYLRSPLLSQSVLKEGRNSMSHLRAAIEGERVKEVTDDMALGSALHTCFLEPEQMPTRVILWDRGARRGKEWAEFSSEHRDKIILTEGYHEKLMGMVKSLRRHPVVREWISKIDAVEVSAIGEVNGVMMRARCDALTPDPLLDLKKVSCGDGRAFTQIVSKFGYHLQGYIYRELFDRERFITLTVEDQPPYDVVPYELSSAFIRQGRKDAVALLDAYKFAEKHNQWPGRADQIIQLELPDYLSDGPGITLDGEEIEL